ncbi:hypothetical protein ACSQ67_023951 [Phaseolus vulgaris]
MIFHLRVPPFSSSTAVPNFVYLLSVATTPSNISLLFAVIGPSIRSRPPLFLSSTIVLPLRCHQSFRRCASIVAPHCTRSASTSPRLTLQGAQHKAIVEFPFPACSKANTKKYEREGTIYKANKCYHPSPPLPLILLTADWMTMVFPLLILLLHTTTKLATSSPSLGGGCLPRALHTADGLYILALTYTSIKAVNE